MGLLGIPSFLPFPLFLSPFSSPSLLLPSLLLFRCLFLGLLFGLFHLAGEHLSSRRVRIGWCCCFLPIFFTYDTFLLSFGQLWQACHASITIAMTSWWPHVARPYAGGIKGTYHPSWRCPPPPFPAPFWGLRHLGFSKPCAYLWVGPHRSNLVPTLVQKKRIEVDRCGLK